MIASTSLGDAGGLLIVTAVGATVAVAGTLVGALVGAAVGAVVGCSTTPWVAVGVASVAVVQAARTIVKITTSTIADCENLERICFSPF
jgi:hypothetical protein